MSQEFDAYYELLGIPPAEQPPNLYRLLGVSLFEDNASVISNAAERQMRFVRTLGGSAFSDVSQRILNELAAAKLALLDRERKKTYDAELRKKTAAPAPPAAAPGPGSTPKDPLRTTAPRAIQEVPEAPAALSADQSLTRSWVIGSSSGCDIVLNAPAVSRMHCRLTEAEEGFWLDDLNSRNGTFVDGQRVTGRAKIAPKNEVTLGKKIPLPWPPPQLSATRQHVVMIGRAAENQLRFEHDTISAFHARVILTGQHAILMDLGSSNGTAINQPANRLPLAILRSGETVFFGDYVVKSDDLLAAIERYRG